MNRLIVRALAAIAAQGEEPARAADEEFEIDGSRFDAELHALVRVATAAEPEGDPMERLGAQLGASLQPQLIEAFTTALRDAGAGQVRQPAAQPNEERPYGSAARATAAAAADWRYRGLPEGERALRDPDTDHEIACYFRAMVAHDRPEQSRALEALMGGETARTEHGRAALAIGAAATGGNIVPTPMANIIVEKRQQMEVIGPRSRRFTSPNQSIDVPTTNAVMTAAIFAEAAAITETDPTFGQVTLSKKKVATATRSSRELLDFTPFDLVGQIGDLAAKAIALAYGTNDADGAGFTDSIFNSAATTVVDAAVGALATADMRALYYGLPQQYRAGAVWLFHADAVKLAGSLLEDGRQWFEAQGATPSGLGGGQGVAGSILGHEVLEEAGIPGLASAEIAFANLQYFGVLDDGSLRVEASDQAAFLADQVIWKFVGFRDGAVLQGEAFAISRAITG